MNLSDVTQRYIGRQYKLGSLDMEEGCDCMSMILDYMKQCGFTIPSEYKGLTLRNYKERFEQDPSVIDVGVEFIAKKATEIEPHKCFAGDIIVATLKDKEGAIKSFGIDAGQGSMLIVSERGTGFVDKKHYNIERVFRCRKRSRY